MARVSIIIPNYNGMRFLPVCLDSIRRQSFQDFTVTIIDNASTDRSVPYLRQAYPEFKVIRLTQNYGFAAAVNLGLAQADSDYICLLNNDLELDSAFLQQLTAVLDAMPEVSFCAAKMINYFQRNILDGAGDQVFRAGAGYRRGYAEPQQFYNQPDIVFGACAGAAMYRQNFFRTIGDFDADFFAYLEDVDLNWRAFLYDLQCRYVPSALAYHIGSGTTGSIFNDFTITHTTKNLLNVVVKNYPIPIIIKSLHVLLIYHAAWFLLVVAKGYLAAYASGIIRGIMDFPRMIQKRRSLLSGLTISIQPLYQSMTFSETCIIDSLIRKRSASGKPVWFLRLYRYLCC